MSADKIAIDVVLTDRSSALYGLFCCLCRLEFVKPVWQASCGDRLCAKCHSGLLAGLSTHSSGSFQCTTCLMEVRLDDCFRDKAAENDLTRGSVPCAYLDCSWSWSSMKYEDRVHDREYTPVSSLISEEKDQRNLIAVSFREARACLEDLPTCTSVEEDELIYNLPVRRARSGVNKVLTDQLTHKRKEVQLPQKSVCRSYFVTAQCLSPVNQSEFYQEVHTSGKEQSSSSGLDSESDNFTGEKLVLPNLLLAPKMVEQELGNSELMAAPMCPPSVHLTFAQSFFMNSGTQQAHTQNLEVQAVPPAKCETAFEACGCPNELVAQERESTTLLLNVIRVSQTMKSLLAELQDLVVQTLQGTKYNREFTWKIPNVAQRIKEVQMERTTALQSPPFYTSQFGYKMCLWLYLNGDGSGKGAFLSFFLTIMRGEYDTLLRWPFQQKVTLMLLDQDKKKNIVQCFCPDPSSSSFWKPKTEMNIASGCPKFAPQSVLDSPSYTRNDTVYFKIIIDTGLGGS